MRRSTDIQLDEVIVHILDTRRSGGLVLSERSLPLSGVDHLLGYFSEHMAHSLADGDTVAAKFKGFEDDSTATVCRSILGGTVDLVDGSRTLARALFDLMTRDQRISPGDLAVIRYRATVDAVAGAYLALLKIDPNEVLVHRTQRDDQGRVFVGFDIQFDVLPATGEKLQKCAFVRQLQPRPDQYDMLLLDRQRRASERPTVARFFMDQFLVAEQAQDDRARTEQLIAGLFTARKELQTSLVPAEVVVLDEAINSLLASTEVDLDAWLHSLSLHVEARRTLDKTVSASLLDRRFALDESVTRKRLAKRRFRGDYGLQVVVNTSNFDSVVKSVMPVDDPGQPRYYRVILHTERWEEIT